MSNRNLAAACLGAALALPGCMGTSNRGMESVHQPVVRRTDYALDLRTDGGGLAPGEPGRLAGWFDAMRLGYGDRVAVDGGDASADAARAEVGGVVAGYGLLVLDAPPVSGAPVAPATVRVVVSRMSASVPRCPDWSRNSSFDFSGNTSSNFGCATNTNLAAMVASPGDLVRGKTDDGGSDPALSYKAIDSYRKAPSTGANGIKAESAGGKK